MSRWASEDHIHTNKLNMADFILNMPSHLFARVFGNPAGDPVLLKSRGVTLLRDNTHIYSISDQVLKIYRYFTEKKKKTTLCAL